MPNVPILRQIVVALRGLVFKARDAGSPASADVLTMAAHAVQDIASAEDKGHTRPPEQVVKRVGQDRR